MKNIAKQKILNLKIKEKKIKKMAFVTVKWI